MRPGRDPQPEVRVGGLHPKVVHQILELVHPLRGHVAVQEDDPGAGLVAFLVMKEEQPLREVKIEEKRKNRKRERERGSV